MAEYSFAECLKHSYKVNWRIEDVLGPGDRFDTGKRWLPRRLSATAAELPFLDEEEQRKLTHVEMAAYAHLFGYVEEFIAPKVTALASEHEIDDREAFDALTNFAAEEVKHMNLFRAVRRRVDETLGFETALIGGEKETARFVLGKCDGAVLMLTACIEWFTQRHYLEAIRDDDGLDPLTRRIFKAHWQEEAQHAKMDHLETLRAFAGMDDARCDVAIDELIELVAGVDGLLGQQTDLDVENLARHTGRTFDDAETAALRRAILAAKRWTFLESGVTHDRFAELFGAVTTPEQQQRVQEALAPLLQPAAAAG